VPEQDSADAAHGRGSVEDEARRLVRAAAHWLQSQDVTTADHAPADGGRDAPDRASQRGQRADRASEATQGAPAQQGPTQEGPPQEGSTCQGCPWCRAKGAVGSPGAETLVSLADLLTSAADSLRSYAESRRRAPEAGQGPAQDDERHDEPHRSEPQESA
jgi:plasmid stability protein